MDEQATSPSPADLPALRKLRDLLAHEDAVIFVGSGVSTWSELPGWRELVQDLARFLRQNGLPSELVDRELANNDLLQAASYGVHQLTAQQFGEFMRGACRVGKASPHRIHELLVKLGPTCFVTSNYDDLLERALATWRPDIHFRMVSNWNLAESANIVEAGARNFVFKPHGDIGNVDSIILTREQYRTLHGNRLFTLETLKTLLVSRPVLFVGFGLRDPDFLYLKDVLATIYEGRARDHYALVAHTSGEEVDYWRRNYGIHLIAYSTDRESGHAGLLTLLEALGTRAESVQNSSSNRSTPALLRYSARVASRFAPQVEVFPLYVNVTREVKGTPHASTFSLHYSFLESVLDQKRINFILIGPPGAGKSFGTQLAVAKQAKALSSDPMTTKVRLEELTVPLYLDLKLFAGDFWEMAQAELPPDLSLQDLVLAQAARFYLDGANEVPQGFLDDGTFKVALDSFLNTIAPCHVVITSRSTDALEHLEWPVLEISEISADFVANALRARGDYLSTAHADEVFSILRKPLFFQQYLSGALDLASIRHPTDIFRTLFSHLDRKYETDFGHAMEFVGLLAPLGYDLMDSGQQTMPLSHLLSQLAQGMGRDEAASIRTADWLIAERLLYPTAQSRVAFAHQAITEYLAATQLARIYRATPSAVRRCLRRRSWDQALFLTLIFLSSTEADAFFQDICEMDLLTACRAVGFLDYGRDEQVSQVLRKLLQLGSVESMEASSIGWAIERLPVSDRHIGLLRELAHRHDSHIGGFAAGRLVQFRPLVSMDELLELLFRKIRDYNFAWFLARGLASVVSVEQLLQVTNRLAQFKPSPDEDQDSGITKAYGSLTRYLDTASLIELFPPIKGLRGMQERALCAALTDRGDRVAVEMTAKLVASGRRAAIYPLYMQLKYRSVEQGVAEGLPHNALLQELLEAVRDRRYFRWAMGVLVALAERSAIAAGKLEDMVDRFNGIMRVCLLYAVHGAASSSVWEALDKLSRDRAPGPLQQAELLVTLEELNWEGKEQILMRLLKRRETPMAWALLETLEGPVTKDQNLTLSSDDIAWCLDWMVEATHAGATRLAALLGLLVVAYSPPETAKAIVQSFESGDARYRRAIGEYILPRMGLDWLTSDDLSPAAMRWLVADLRQGIIGRYWGSLLGHIATERFVEESLLPLLPQATEPMRSNLIYVLRECGSRHGRRYITMVGDPM